MKNFKQFTTPTWKYQKSSTVFMMVQRWRISSNSQPGLVYQGNELRCLWWFKDEEFQAIHNKIATFNFPRSGVYDGSKMKNFKQFTTASTMQKVAALVFMMVQRWRISSNSQPHRLMIASFIGCLWWFKDEEFQAIHNRWPLWPLRHGGVYDGSKMKNFKQFTT